MTMKQPAIAPVAAGGAIIAGVASMFIGGYKIADCLQFQSEYGFCNEVVETNTVSLVAGGAAVIGSVGGLFTYNRRLERPDGSVPNLDPAELLLEEKRKVFLLHGLGNTQLEIARQLGISRYRVRKHLNG